MKKREIFNSRFWLAGFMNMRRKCINNTDTHCTTITIEKEERIGTLTQQLKRSYCFPSTIMQKDKEKELQNEQLKTQELKSS